MKTYIQTLIALFASALLLPAEDNHYKVLNQWGEESAPWKDGGSWVMGSRSEQNIVALEVKSDDGGETLIGTVTYEGEGPIGFKGESGEPHTYYVKNEFGGAWHEGGAWYIGDRDNQEVVALSLKSEDGGRTLEGTMTYSGEGAIRVRAALFNAYEVENRWGDAAEPWRAGGHWTLGGRLEQKAVQFSIKSDDDGQTLTGTMTYAGEGSVDFRAKRVKQNTYKVENHWGDAAEPWHEAGTWKLGGRDDQNVVGLEVKSENEGKDFSGTVTYKGEGPIDFRARIFVP
ncbi:MAG: hypothetical protein JNJ83_04820 [Verrucomicrobiaceae bacterium]|nr:hypothetical protein [Verrucomicrobiaceae bacterium]